MENSDMNLPTFGIKTAEGHPIKVSMIAVLGLLAAVWAFYRPALINDLSADFVTTLQMEQHIAQQNLQVASLNTRLDTIDTKLGSMLAKDARADAYSIIGSVEGDIDRHNKLKSNDPAWAQTNKQLNERLKTAIEYRDCVMADRRNCVLIKEQIWQ